MNKLEFFKTMHTLVTTCNEQTLAMSMRDTHHEGLFSLVIGGTEFGNLTRVFIADSDINPFEVQLHSHRYGIRLTAIKGRIRHYTARRSKVSNFHTTSLSEFSYKSPLNGGRGLEYLKETEVLLEEHYLPTGSSLQMHVDDIHTVSCKKGAMWIVEECGFERDSSRVLGVPFVTEGLYNPPASFQVNDKVQLVARELKSLILNYELV